jgi:hypothetical protein
LCKCGIVAKEYSAQECSFSEQVTVLGDYAMWGTAGSFHYIEAWKWQQFKNPIHVQQRFWSLGSVYEHQLKIMSYNVVKNDNTLPTQMLKVYHQLD